MVIPSVPCIEQTVYASRVRSRKANEKPTRDRVCDSADQGRNSHDSEQRSATVNGEDVIRSASAQPMRDFVYKAVLNLRQETS